MDAHEPPIQNRTAEDIRGNAREGRLQLRATHHEISGHQRATSRLRQRLPSDNRGVPTANSPGVSPAREAMASPDKT